MFRLLAAAPMRVTSLLALLLAGCGGAPAAAPVRPLAIPPVAPPRVAVYQLAIGALPRGCFARARNGAYACIVGQAGELRFVVFQADASGPPDVALPDRLTDDVRDHLNAILREGDYVALADPAVKVALGADGWFNRLHVDLRESISSEWRPLEGRGARAFVRKEITILHTIIRIDPAQKSRELAGEDDPPPESFDETLWVNTLADVACEAPALAVRTIGTSAILVERECHAGDAVYVAATLCNADYGRCT